VAFKIILTDSALKDFESLMIWSLDHYAANSEKFGTSLLNHVDLLKAFPLIGHPVKDYANVRRLLHSPLYVD
jgi:plasmid stabilization system protein ParE